MTSDFECWENEETGLRTEIPFPGDAGDLGVFQTKLEGFAKSGRIVANYDYRSTFLLHLVIFHLQNGMPVSNRQDWNEKFFDGNYTASESVFFDLFRIKRHAETGRLLKIVAEAELDEKNDAITPIPQAFSSGLFKLWPVLTSENHLTYIKIPGREQEILLTREDVSMAFEVVRTHMLRGIRAHKGELGKIYSQFPFEAYEQDYERARASTK